MIEEGFFEEISKLEGVDVEAFRSAMAAVPVVSIKLNRRKCAAVGELGYGDPERVTWCPSGFYLSERPQFTLNPLLHAGVFYVQEASSMIHESIVERLLEMDLLGPMPSVLDTCASPGGKTTSVINALPDGSQVVANEFVPQRAAVLRENLIKWGYPDIMALNAPVDRIAAAAPEAFDLVVVDAPCSGEGMMRKEPKAAEQWSLRLIAQCAELQREILAHALECLRSGGVLIYSTCTFNRTENEENVLWMQTEYGLESIDMQLPREWGIGSSIDERVKAMRFMPHLTRGEGLFVAVLRKPGVPSRSNFSRVKEALRKKTKVVLDGIPSTIAKGKLMIPASEGVLSVKWRPDNAVPMLEVDRETALRYLRHEAVALPPEAPRGFLALAFESHPLGLVKNIGNRANNLYPAAWKIKMNIE